MFESFAINGQYYIAVANQGSENNYEVVSTIYLMFENGTMFHYQDIPTQAASDVKMFRPQGSNDSYLIFANMKDNTGNTDISSKVRCCLLLYCCLVFDCRFPLSHFRACSAPEEIVFFLNTNP